MALRISGMGMSVVFSIVQDVRYSAETEVADISIPEEDRPWLVGLGGAKISMTVVAREVVSSDVELRNLIGSVRRLITGKIMPRFTVTIDEWGISEEGIVKTIEISQVAGEPSVIEVRLNLLVGMVI